MSPTWQEVVLINNWCTMFWNFCVIGSHTCTSRGIYFFSFIHLFFLLQTVFVSFNCWKVCGQCRIFWRSSSLENNLHQGNIVAYVLKSISDMLHIITKVVFLTKQIQFLHILKMSNTACSLSVNTEKHLCSRAKTEITDYFWASELWKWNISVFPYWCKPTKMKGKSWHWCFSSPKVKSVVFFALAVCSWRSVTTDPYDKSFSVLWVCVFYPEQGLFTLHKYISNRLISCCHGVSKYERWRTNERKWRWR